MIIFMDIKPFIVAGFVLLFINASDCRPLSYPRKARHSGLQGRMTMLRKSCKDSLGNIGICMFKWDCISQRGITLSTCVDGFLFGACCSLKEDSQETWTYNDHEQRNTVSFIRDTTVGYLQQIADPSVNEREGLVNNSLPIIGSNDTIEVSVTTDSTDAYTSSELFFSKSMTISDIEKLNIFQSAPSSLNVSSSNYSVIDQVMNYDSSENKTMENQTNIELKSPTIFLNFETKEDNIKKSQTYKTKNNTEFNTVTEFQYFINLSSGESYTNNTSETRESVGNITTDSTVYDTTANYYTSEMTLFHTEYQKFDNFDSFKAESDKPELESETTEGSLFNNITNFLGNESYLINTNGSSITFIKYIENSTINDNLPPVWDNGTHVLPSSLQAVISQLTSREASYVKPGVDPTVQSNLTSIISNTGKGEKLESFFQKNLKNNINLSLNNQSIYTDKKPNLASQLPEKSQQTPGTIQSINQSFITVLNSAISETPLTNTNVALNVVTSSYTNIPQITTNMSEDISSIWTSESDKHEPNVNIVESQTQDTEDILKNFLLTNAQDNVKAECDDKNNTTENCIKNYTYSKNAQINNPFITTNGIFQNVRTTYNNLTFVTNTIDFDKSAHENQQDKNNEILTELISQSNSTNVFAQETLANKISSSVENHVNDNNIKNNFENVEETEADSVKLINVDPGVSVSNSLSSNEFLFDITTDILKFFTKPEDSNSDSSESSHPNIFSITDRFEENISIENSKENLIPPSHAHTQQTYEDSYDNTISEILHDLSTKYPSSSTTENFGENLFSTHSPTFNSFIADVVTQNIRDEDPVDNELYTKNTNFTAHNSTLHEDFNEIQDRDEIDLHFNGYSSYYANTSVSNYFKSTVTNLITDTEPKSTLSEVYHEGTTKIHDVPPTVTLNLFQNVTDIYTVSHLVPLVHITTSDTDEDNSLAGIIYNHSSHQTIPHNVNIFNNAQSTSSMYTTHSVTNMGIHKNESLHHQSTIHNVDIFNNTESDNLLYTIHNITSTETDSGTTVTNSNSVLATIENISTTLKPSQQTLEKPIKNKVWNYKKDCGVRPMQPIGRIVGGRNTYFGKWPWQALVKEATWLGLFVKNKCGGVLITSKYVLTAAHCQPGFLASLLVVLGTHDISNLKDNGLPTIRNVKRMVVHRLYNPQTFENDLALLEMDSELEFMPHVVPICLPHRNEDFTGEMAFVTGWGKLTHGGDVPNILQEVQVPIVANSECQMMFYQAGHQKAIQNNFVCAGYTNGGQDSCEGDSGGPLMVQRKDKRWVLVGTVSHGIGCADPNLPGVYMRMSAYRPWIDSIINK